MLSYSFLMSDGGPHTGHYVELQEAKLMELIRLLLLQVDMDEDWYLRANPDVADAIKAGTLRSAREHYVVAGYFENRLPRPVEVDADWYVAQYSDVADAIKSGAILSARQHFERSGYLQGRLPSPGWSLLSDAPKAPAAKPAAVPGRLFSPAGSARAANAG